MLTTSKLLAKQTLFQSAFSFTFQNSRPKFLMCTKLIAILFMIMCNTTTMAFSLFIPNFSIESDTEFNEDSLKVLLDDVEVLATRVPLAQSHIPRMVTVLSAEDISSAPVHSINDLLEYVAGVDVRQRGDFGVQTDLSIRGGTFDQITLLLNGINISSPHTGHLSADFPLSMQDIERIEVLEGPAARIFGTSAFTGAINIVTKQESDAGLLHLSAGDYGYASGDLRLSKKHRVGDSGAEMNHHLSGGYGRSDGAVPNSYFERTRLFYQGNYTSQKLLLNAQLGYSYKPYAANTFYGASSTDQWESNERMMAALRGDIDCNGLHLLPSVYWNRWYDHYQWHKDQPAGENYHQVDLCGASLDGWFNSSLGKTSLGIEMRYEGIYSTKLGMPMSNPKPIGGHDATNDVQYTMADDRINLSAFLEHNILLEQWTVSLGVLATMNTGLDHRFRFYPGIDVAYHFTDEWKFFASWAMALRMPTFTDLYYSGANIEGNKQLNPEKTNDFSVGSRYRCPGVKADVSLFYSHKNNMIDWVVYADEAAGLETKDWTFRSGNFRLDNVGLEVAAYFLPRELLNNSIPFISRIGIQYAYINEQQEYYRAVVQSKYAMEYLRHKVVLQVEGCIIGNLNTSLSWRWQERNGAANASYGLLDARLSWDAPQWSLYADCSNLLNKTYYDYSIVRQPGRWLKAGFLWRFGL